MTSHTLAQALTDQGVDYWRITPGNGAIPAATASRLFVWLPAASLKPMGLLTTPHLNGTASVGMFNGDMTSVVFKD